MGTVVVVGSTNTDMTVRVGHIPQPGETVLGGEFYMSGGGKGANQAVSATRAGADVALVARIGDDMFGREAEQRFVEDGIETTHLLRSEGVASGVALIVVDDEGENAISVAPGANAALTPADVNAAEDVIARAEVLLVQLEIPMETVARALRLARNHGVRTILDPAPAQELSDELLSMVSVITPNEGEAQALTGVSADAPQAVTQMADYLRERGVETVILTLGSGGAYVASKNGEFRVDGFNVEAVDTTAAGDVFAGAVASALSDGNEMRRAVSFANKAAAISVQHPGAQPSAPDRQAIEGYG